MPYCRVSQRNMGLATYNGAGSRERTGQALERRATYNHRRSIQLRRLIVHTSGVLHTIARQCVADGKRWFPETAEALPFTALALCGEVGELANIVKKIARGSLNIKDAKTR